MGHRAVVIGASGFAGAELLRLLSGHPGIDVAAAAAHTQAGKNVTELYPHLVSYAGVTFVEIEEAMSLGADIAFSSLPHTQSMRLFDSESGSKIVDLAGDFRLHDPAAYPEWYAAEHSHPETLKEWVYGLTEYHRDEVASAHFVANPGCYPAAAILALGPLVEAGTISLVGIHIDAKSGVSGAGRALGGEGFDFAFANENARAYKVTGHNHIPEIEQELSALGGSKVVVSFVPHLIPATRGILATCIAPLADPATGTAELIEVLRSRYAGEPFVRVLGEDSLPETKRLSGTNVAEVTARVDARTGTAISVVALDNLGKGAAGQAIQNANLMLGYPETTALERSGLIP